MSTVLCGRIFPVNLGRVYSLEKLVRFLKTGGRMVCLRQNNRQSDCKSFEINSVYYLVKQNPHDELVLSNGKHIRSRYFGDQNGWQIDGNLLIHAAEYKFRLIR